MKATILGLLLGLVFIPPWGTFAQDSGLYVDAAQKHGDISPLIYGANHGPWTFISLDLLPYAENSGITFLRFPGGNWGDLNNITPKQIDDFITLCNRLGAEPSISVRLKGGTAEVAAELVRYTNVEKGYNVRYWSIGNEPNLYPDYNTELFNQQWRVFAEAMRAVDPSILLMGPELSQYPPDPAQLKKDSAGRDWLIEFLKANGDIVDIVSVHRYPFPIKQGQSTTIADLRQNPAEWEIIIPNLRQIIQDTTGRDIPIAITEINSHWNNSIFGEATPDSFYNAIWLADVLGRLIQHQVEVVAYFTLQTPNSFGGAGLLANYAPRPSYYIYQLYQQFGTTLIEASSSEPDVSIYAAQRDDGTLTLIVINLGSDEKILPLHIDHFTPDSDIDTWQFDVEHNAEVTGTFSLQAGTAPLNLPAQSVLLLIVAP
jgi:hypothetical protein